MRIPKPEERAGFQSLSSSIQSFTMALSAMAIPVIILFERSQIGKATRAPAPSPDKP